MQVLCVESAEAQPDVSCAVCGRAYKVYYSRMNSAECEDALRAVQAALTEHHADDPTEHAHPKRAFNVPEWSGPAHMSAAALLSGAPLAAEPRPMPVLASVQEQQAS